jgi:hypothetical protein
MPTGSEIISGDITLNDLVEMVVAVLEQQSTGVGEFPVAGSLNGINSLPAIRGAGTTNEVVTVSLSLLKGTNGVDGKTAKFSVGTVTSSAAGGSASVTLPPDGVDENGNPKFKLNFILPRGQNGAGIVVKVTTTAVQYKYDGEADSAYRTMFTIDQLRLKFTDLTSAQKDELRLHYSDLTVANIAELQQPATAAAAVANQAATGANQAKTEAQSAANYANTAAGNAESTILLMQQLAQVITGGASLTPVRMEIDYPGYITVGNPYAKSISVKLLPAYVLQNVLYLGDDNAVEVSPGGAITVKKTGRSRIYVIPPGNTLLYKTITIDVVSPALRLLSGIRLRLVTNNTVRLT